MLGAALFCVVIQRSFSSPCLGGVPGGLPTIVTNCSNNYGPYAPEKLIPLVILNAPEGKPLPIYAARD